jgi:hypothetical protein
VRTNLVRWARVIPTTTLLLSAALCCAQSAAPVSSDASLSKDQIKKFLETARIIGEKTSKKGITAPSRLTLTDGTITHDASFQSEDEHTLVKRFQTGGSEMNFVDSYKYNIAAYILAEMVGFDDLMPVYVEREWKGKEGSLSWWLPAKMDEADRTAKHIPIPDSMTDKWNAQMYRIRVFDQLVYDTDPNLTNLLIGDNWQVWRVDFSRAFRLYDEPRSYKDLTHCDRQLFEKLKALNGDEFAERAKPYLTKGEIKAVMKRRDKIVEYLQKEIAEKGEANVLY